MQHIIPHNILSQTITKRPAVSHKGTYGRVALIGGNQQFGGAIILASEAAVNTGAGLVTTVTAPENHASLHARLPEAMVVDWTDLPAVKEIVRQASVIVIGPGLGLDSQSLALLKLVFASVTRQQVCVVDGSALTLMAEHDVTVPNHSAAFILTPHKKEWERLSGIPVTEQNEERNLLAKEKIPAAVVLKKHRTEIFFETDTYLNPIGTPAMATGGMGDTLAGIIAGFTAQFQPKDKALLAAVYLHSLLGEQLGKSHYVALPSKLIGLISRTMKQFET